MDFIEEAYPTGDNGYSLLPSDAVLRAKMRLAFPLMDAINGAWFPIYMKKSYDEELFKKLHEALQKVEDYLASNATDSKPFALGTEHPTQLDAHLYVHLIRIAMIKDSAFHESIYKHIGFEKYNHINKLLESVRARPEFDKILAKPRPYHNQLAKLAEKPPGERVQLFLPNPNDD